MKSFNMFRLDTVNHFLWRGEERVPIAPKAFDMLSYLVEHAGEVVTQNDLLEALWPESYVNPEILRKYILELRKALGDRHRDPQFIETLPKRGYRFVAPVVDADNGQPEPPASDATAGAEPAAAPSEQRRSPGRNRVWILAFSVVLVAALFGYLKLTNGRTSVSPLKSASIAVLPFANMNLTKDQEYFSEGLSEQLIVDLAKVSGLKVIGRSSSFHFKGSDQDARDVGRKLGVANILEGSVRRDGNHVRITAELIKADDDTQLWSQKYDRSIKDIFALEDEIAQSATKALQVKLLGGNNQPIAQDQRSVDPEAYQAYIQAMHFSRIGQVEDLDKALAFADKAIELDGKYAAAWALRAHVQNSIAAISITDPSENFRQARDDAERAVALDPNLASAYLALATTQLLYGWDWDAANTLIAKAEILEPGSDEVLRSRAHLLRILGNLDEAIKLYEQAITFDPLRLHSYMGLGYLQYTAGRYEEARSTLRKYLDLNPHGAYAHLTLCKILIAEGKPQEAIAEIEKEPSTSAGKLSGEALAYHSLGREKDSNAVLEEIISKHAVGAAYEIAQIYAYRGQPDKSFEWLERAYRQRDAGMPLLDTDPLFKGLHRDSRYIELLRRMHLTVLQ